MTPPLSPDLLAASWISAEPAADDEFHPIRRAQWIGPDAAASEETLIAFSKEFHIPSGIERAFLHYWVDGRPHNDHRLGEPRDRMTDPMIWTFVQVNGRGQSAFAGFARLLEIRTPITSDITALVREGSNRLAFLSWMRRPEPSAVAMIEVTLRDGTKLWVPTDASWTCRVLDFEEANRPDWDNAGNAAPVRVRCAFEEAPWDDVRGTLNQPAPPVVLRRSFPLPPQPIASATLESSAVGNYDMDVNGHRAGEGFLAPGWTDTRKSVQVQSCNVTDLLRPGENVWTATVAKGWAGSPMQGQVSLREGIKAFRAALHVRYADGSVVVISTDADNWESATGAVRDSEIYNGETVDFTRIENWRPAVVAPVPPVALVPQTLAPPQVIREFVPLEIRPHGEKTWIVDFGQNFSGFVRLSLDEPRGTEVVLRHAESLRTDGTLMTVNLRFANCTDRVICPGGPFVFQPRFTFRGFRYVEISGISAAPSHLRGIAISNAVRPTLELDFASAGLNRLVEAIRWTQRSNWLCVPLDCPQRSERLGWMGDNEVFAPSGMLLFDGRDFQAKHLDDIYEAAHENGSLPDFVPCGGGAGPVATYGWADAGVVLPHAIWKIHADLAPARNHWTGIRKYLAHRDASADADGLNVTGVYGDWLTIEPMTPHAILGPVFQAYTHRLAAELANALDDKEAETHHARRFREIAAVWCARHLRADGMIESDTQGIYLCAWHTGLIPSEAKPAVARALRAAFTRWEDHLRTGILSTPRALDVLIEAGHHDLAWRILTDDTFPSYGYFLKEGATTIPEWWDPWPGEQEVTEYWKNYDGDRAMNDVSGSLNHPALCAVFEGIFHHVWGLRQTPQSSGFEEIVLQPQFTDKLDRASGMFHSARGPISVAWQRSEDSVRFDVAIPEGCRARLIPPDAAPLDLPAGRSSWHRGSFC